MNDPVNPNIVAIGGGTGLSNLLMGLKYWTNNLTAVVTVSDDGGSSGRLRKDLGIPPPGDARNCLTALAPDSYTKQLFQYQFDKGTSLYGHRLGNLILAAVQQGTGNFEKSLEISATLLNSKGSVLPVSNRNDIVLMGKTVRGDILVGESVIGNSSEKIRDVWIEPKSTEASSSVLTAIEKADLLVFGPGSLYTSVIPNFLFQGMGMAIAKSKAPKLFVCNVATELYETDGLNAQDHVRIFETITGVKCSHVILNANCKDIPEEVGRHCIYPEAFVNDPSVKILLKDVINEDDRVMHDADKLAREIMDVTFTRNTIVH
tara:strand:+ start:14415 stop:15368 length:954 start_codon:yes stop_codon:yes gene_type:complete